MLELTLNIKAEFIEKILLDCGCGLKNQPTNHEKEKTGYWTHHLAQIGIERAGEDKLCVSGSSGFYFPTMTYSGLDYVNTLLKRYTLMRHIKGTWFDLSLPRKMGYKMSGKYISLDFLRSIHYAKTTSYSQGRVTTIPKKILEIGSGTGIQALVFKLLYEHSNYFLVDFPQTLALAQTFLCYALPESKFLFYHEWKDNPELLKGDYDFIFVPNYEISKIPDHSINLAINTVSMQEMNYNTINMYFKELRRLLTQPRLFFQCNRDKEMDGELIEVSKYPYTSDDQHLFIKKDNFHKTAIGVRKCFGRFPLLSWIRIPVIKTKGAQISSLTKLSPL